MKRSIRHMIKECVDNLPAGICFADSRGGIILCNRQMSRLCQTLMGTDLQHIDELRAALITPPSGVQPVDPKSDALRFPDGSVWGFRESAITAGDGKRYIQMQAFDATQLYEKRAELERENALLAETNTRAKRLYAELDRTVREEETFAIKMRVHDDIGMCLLSTRRALEENSPLSQLQEAGALWQQAMARISRDPSPQESKGAGANEAGSALQTLIASARGIGIRILLDGSLPEHNAYLLITAMRECATNAVRHAGASEMTVSLQTDGGRTAAKITNNGAPPQGKIVEGGGLSGLRRRVELAGGTMEVVSSPSFALIITLPEKEDLP